MPDQQPIDLAEQYESGKKNVLNYLYDPKHTAGGYWQITDTNWKQYAPKVGIDTKKYPTAVSLDDEKQQRKVAEYILNNTPKGIRNWTDYNPKLRAALGGDAMPQEQDYSQWTDQQLIDAAKKDPNLAKRLVSSGDKKGAVKPPEKGWFQRFAEEGEPSSTFAPSQGFGLVPGARKLTRAATGYGLPPDATWKTRAAEGLEGLGDISVPIGTGAAVLGTGGAAGGALLGGEGLTAAAGAGGRALLPYLLGAGGSGVGSTVAGSAAEEMFPDDPEARRLTSDVGGVVGGLLGGFGGPRVLTNPAGRAAVGALLGHMSGIPYGGEIGAFLGGTGEYMPGRLGTMFRGIRQAVSPIPKTATVKPSAGPKPPSLEKLQQMHADGVIDQQRLEEIYKGAPLTAQEISADAHNQVWKEANEENARIKEKQQEQARQEQIRQDNIRRRQAEKQAEQQRQDALRAQKEAKEATSTGGAVISPTNPLTATPTSGTNVSIPSGSQVNIKQAPTGPVSPPTGSQGLGQTGISPLQGTSQFGGPQPTAPVEAPPAIPPGLTSFGPQPENQLAGTMGRPFVGPSAAGTPTPPPLPQTGAPNLPVESPQQAPQPLQGLQVSDPRVPQVPRAATPVPPLTKPAESMTPIPKQLTPLQIVDEATKKGVKPPKGGSKITRDKAAKKIGLNFTPTREEFMQAREIYDDRERAARPTASIPS